MESFEEENEQLQSPSSSSSSSSSSFLSQSQQEDLRKIEKKEQQQQQQQQQKYEKQRNEKNSTPHIGHISSWSKLGWLFALIFLGLIPGLITFPIWAIFETTPFLFFDPLTAFFIKFIAPLAQPFDRQQTTVGFHAIWNMTLFMTWCFIHVFLAEKPGNTLLKQIVRPQTVRATYIILSSIGSSLLLALWKPTNVVVWSLEKFVPDCLPELKGLMPYFFGIIGGFCLAQMYLVITELDGWFFVGLKQFWMSDSELVRTVGSEKLKTGAHFSWVRHPLGSFTMLSLLVSSPVMTLDRLLLFLGTSFVFLVALPLEERRMLEIFGEQFEMYKKKVPYRFIPYVF